MKPKIVYVVTIPWDSARVDKAYVFSKKKDADTFCAKRNEAGYHGYCGGLCVDECYVDDTDV